MSVPREKVNAVLKVDKVIFKNEFPQGALCCFFPIVTVSSEATRLGGFCRYPDEIAPNALQGKLISGNHLNEMALGLYGMVKAVVCRYPLRKGSDYRIFARILPRSSIPPAISSDQRLPQLSRMKWPYLSWVEKTAPGATLTPRDRAS